MIDVKHIAKLARLGLTKEEEKKFETELSSILDFVEKLKEVKTENIEPTAQATGVFNVFRESQTHPICQDEKMKEDILKNAPNKEGRYFKVKRVLE